MPTPLSLTEAMRRRSRDEPVRVGVIGTGAYGSGIVAQAPRVPLLDVPIVAEQDPEKARQAYVSSGIGESDIVVCEGRAEALVAIEAGRRVVAENPLLLMELPLDVIVECTGVAEAGARHAREAIRHGKHVVMVTKEADVTVGPILKHLADEAGLVYTAADGDQPGLLISLVAWARRIGLEVLCAGKARNAEIPFDPVAREIRLSRKTIPVADDDAWMFGPVAAGEAERYVVARREKLGDLARLGSWDLGEMTIVANATGLRPDVPPVHCPPVYISDIPTVLCDGERGGILEAPGAVDAVTCMRHPDDAGLAGGVFVVLDGQTETARGVLRRAGTAAARGASASLITRPYHLLGVETVETILTAALLGVPTGATEYSPRYDLVLQAPRAFKAGEVVDLHAERRDVEALMLPAQPVIDGAPLPGHTSDGCEAAVDIPAGAVLTREMVRAPTDSALWSLRAQQDERFLHSDA